MLLRISRKRGFMSGPVTNGMERYPCFKNGRRALPFFSGMECDTGHCCQAKPINVSSWRRVSR
jgi:hypothetical protein